MNAFNSKLVEGREKPNITCMEFIREYLMKVSSTPMDPFVVNMREKSCTCMSMGVYWFMLVGLRRKGQKQWMKGVTKLKSCLENL
uniref:Uncharacterized protein n=1 Tax=Lactuca sativa TaxID=4236 RepID=A0A9R1XP04_LACSA|nr:hypothetical protein LSAT_V11C400186230 [Lactuca sativa]